MKRIVHLLTLLVLLSLACSTIQGSDATQAPDTPGVTTEEDTPAPVMADSFFYGYAYIDANGNGQLDTDDPPLEGALFVATDSRGANGGDFTITLV